MSNLCYTMNQENYCKIPGNPFAYWVSNSFLQSFSSKTIKEKTKCAAGVSSGNNEKYLRFWYEVDYSQMTTDCENNDSFQKSHFRYVPCNKGGTFRKWYGNNEYIARWKFSQEFHRNGSTYQELLFIEGLTWSAITTDKFSARYYPKGFIFDHASPSLFAKSRSELICYIALLNSVISDYYLRVINPTINTGADSVRKIPVRVEELGLSNINDLSDTNIRVTKTDWDSFETSWEFKKHPLI